MTDAGHPDGFPTTKWTLVVRAKGDARARQEALADLVERYWRPLYLYARRRGLSRADAEDLVQGLMARLLERDFIANLDPGRGRLRNFLRSALRNYWVNEHARRTAVKRGGPASGIALEFEVAERRLDQMPNDPERAYDRAWAWNVVERCLSRLVAEYEQGVRRGPAALLRQLFGFEEPRSHAELAAEHDMTIPQIKSLAHRARKRFRELVLAEVADTVDTPPEVLDEAKVLFELLGWTHAS